MKKNDGHMVTAVTVTVCKTFSIVFLGTSIFSSYLCPQVSAIPEIFDY